MSDRPKTLEPLEWKRGLSDYQVVTKLMARMGGKKGFNPIPPPQHQWQRGKGEPPLYRLWSWMCDHTIHWGHRSEYAVNKEGQELHIEHAAKDLGMDAGNVRDAWRQGCERGLWRNGNKEEGKRKLYLRGDVPAPAEVTGEDKGKEKVRTDLLPPYIVSQIKELPLARQYDFWKTYERLVTVEKAVQADLMAAARLIVGQDYDTHFREFGIKKIKETHPSKLPPEEAEARQKRIDALLPQLQGFVQTVAVSVQTPEDGVYTDEEKARIAAAKTKSANPTLLGSETSHGKSPESERRVTSDAASSPVRPPHSDDGKKRNQLPAVVPAKLTQQEADAVSSLFSDFASMQRKFKHTDFGNKEFSPDRPSDRLLVYRVLISVGVENVDDFVEHCWQKFKGDKFAMDREAKSLAPGTQYGPNSFGLILSWAVAYGGRLAEAARSPAEEQKRFRDYEVQACRQLLADPQSNVHSKVAVRQRLLQEFNIFAAPDQKERQQEMEFCRALIADSSLPGQSRDYYREVLRSYEQQAKGTSAK